MGTTKIKDLILYFSENIRKVLSPYEMCENITEIRLRTGRGVSVRIGSENILLGGYIVSKEDMEYSFKAICNYSVYSYSKELSEGFITLKGGHRVGICGTAVTENGKVNNINYISGLNFRIANEHKGIADKIMTDIFSREKCGIIIAGPPLCGKTTILRDLCRQIGNKNKVSLIDERGEIASVYKGVPQNEIGIFTDVFDGYPKTEGILIAIRTMSPDYIFVDEIGTEEDYNAIFRSVCCGTEIIATVHASSLNSLKKRDSINKLFKTGAFRYIVFLESNNGFFGKMVIEEVADV
ncbi:MAG: Flp pilus assembly complex ATPase component TadA [Oscillospiraceae bacterium]|nr:Flp pilus assembly complex ATPase component TadA [Oscillospiraceae bacterium]MBR4093372.1 Flp pilus assembly complex ATPase component TadA [Oscillospiraceae bacterium]